MTVIPRRPAITAEWQCTKCGSTNRRLVEPKAREARDRCYSCHRRHVITQESRPVRWASRAA